MQSTTLTVFFLLFCSQSLAVRDIGGVASRSLLLQPSGTSVSASATATSTGSVIIMASARSFSVSEAQNAFQSAITTVTAEAAAGTETGVMVDQAVRAFAEAVASAFVEASVSIISTSPGSTACARTTVNAEASAEATARAVIDVLAQATNPQIFVSASDAIEALESVMVSAFASANINACLNGIGQVNVMVSQLAQVVGTATAEVTAAVVASASPDSAIVQIDVGASGDRVFVTTIEGVNTNDSSGDVQVDASTTFTASTGKR